MEPEKQLRGTVTVDWPDSLIVAVYVPFALKVTLPVSLMEVMFSVSPGQAALDIVVAPVEHALSIVQVPTRFPPQGLVGLQVALPPELLPQDDVATSTVTDRSRAGNARSIADDGRASPRDVPDESTWTAFSSRKRQEYLRLEGAREEQRTH
jgi:hypothetical protein